MEFAATKAKYVGSEIHRELFDRMDFDYPVEKLIEQLEQDNWSLYEVTLDKTLVAVFICRVEKTILDTNDLVILHAASLLKEKVSSYAILEPLFDTIAKKSKCKTIRIHTTSDAVTRLIKKYTTNYTITETIFSKDL